MINIGWQIMGIFDDVTEEKVFPVIRIILGIHLLVIGNYTELEVLKRVGVLNGTNERRIKFFQIGTFLYCYFLTWAAVAEKIVVIADTVITNWSKYGYPLMPLSFIAYSNFQIFYLFHLLHKESKKSRFDPNFTTNYDRIKVYFVLVAIIDWPALVIWLGGYIDVTKESIRIGEALLGLHIGLLTLYFHQIEAFDLGQEHHKETTEEIKTADTSQSLMIQNIPQKVENSTQTSQRTNLQMNFPDIGFSRP
jgi:hypothetical protein